MHHPVRIRLGASPHMPGQPRFGLRVLRRPHPGALRPAPHPGHQFIHLNMHNRQSLEKLFMQSFAVLPIPFQPARNRGGLCPITSLMSAMLMPFIARCVASVTRSLARLEPIQRRPQPGGVFLPTRPAFPLIRRFTPIPLPIPPQRMKVWIRILVVPTQSHSYTLARCCHVPSVVPAGSSPPTTIVAPGCAAVPLPLRPAGSPDSHPVSVAAASRAVSAWLASLSTTLEGPLILLPHHHAQQHHHHDAFDQQRHFLHPSPHRVILQPSHSTLLDRLWQQKRVSCPLD